MPKHLHSEIERLKKSILSLSSMVEENARSAVRSVIERDDKLARQVADADIDVDTAEVELEENCLKILALHQPVAIDLRFIIALLKINNDLERIGDEAVNIAERAIYLATHEQVGIDIDFPVMAEKVENMLRMSLDSFVDYDADKARAVIELDDEVDNLNREVYQIIKTKLHGNERHVSTLIHLLAVSRHLERIADHATNIAEDVIYMIDGVITRHRHEQFSKE